MQSFLFKKKALMFTKVIQEKAEKSKFFKQSRYSDIKNKFMLKKKQNKIQVAHNCTNKTKNIGHRSLPLSVSNPIH